MKLNQKEIALLSEIARAAGREIMSVYNTHFNSWKKNDSSPLTKADLRADEVIRRELESVFPGIFVLSEESTTSQPTKTNSYFLVDPLDGTKEFIKRNGEFTVNIALIHLGQPVASVVFAPAINELFYATREIGAWKVTSGAQSRISVAPLETNRPLRVLGSRSHQSSTLSSWLTKLALTHTFTSIGSSLKFCRIAEGEADLYPRFGPTSQWDTAAAQCVLECAGGMILDAFQNSLRYGLDQPILNPHFIALGDKKLRDVITFP